jgi:hypothetical protein
MTGTPDRHPRGKTAKDAHEVQTMKEREPTQHDLMKENLPKHDVADSLEVFDGDEA